MNDPLNDIIKCATCGRYKTVDEFTLKAIHTRGKKVCSACRKANYTSKHIRMLTRRNLDKKKDINAKQELCNWNGDALYC